MNWKKMLKTEEGKKKYNQWEIDEAAEYGLSVEEYRTIERESEDSVETHEVSRDMHIYIGEQDGRIALFLDRDVMDSQGYQQKDWYILSSLIDEANQDAHDKAFNEAIESAKKSKGE